MSREAVTREEMAEIDARAQTEYGIPQGLLMENAGLSVFRNIIDLHPELHNELVSVFCGKGNNGGDGFVVSRYLAERSPKELTVYTLKGSEIKKGPAMENFKALQDALRGKGARICGFDDFLSDNRAERFTIAVDAVFGTGFTGEAGGIYSEIFRKMNRCVKDVFSVDIPSGLDANTGKACLDCVKARTTVTFGLAKRGFFVNDGPSVCGRVIVENIGFPGKLLDEYRRRRTGGALP